MDFRFTAHDPQTGDFLHRLPRPEKVQIGDTFGTRGTLELTYSSKTLNAKQMPTFVEIRQEATFDAGQTWAQIGPNYLRLSGSHEDTDQAGMRTVKFVSREWLLGKARVGEGDLPLIDGKRPFYQASPGDIMRTLLLEAKDRGAAQGIEIGGFTATKDSSGNDWPKVATIYYSPGLPILDVLENLVEQGLCDYRMDGNIMRLYEPETTMGRDLTTGNDPVRVHGSVTEAPVSYTLEDLTTSALLIGEEGFSLEVNNPSAPDDYGRLEATIEQGGVSDAGTARIMVDETLQKGSREIREITRTQRVEGLRHIPYRDYRVGDFVQVRDQGAWERYRVREIQLVRDDKGWTVHTVINDRLQELLLKLAKRTSGIVNGSSGSGGDGTPPAPPSRPGIEPAAPEGLILDQQVYLDRQGIARGVITAGWGEVTQSTKGKAIDIGGYELWWRRNETYATWTRATSTTGETTVSHSPVVLTDTDGTAMEYQWRVRAVAQESARPGPFSNIVTLTMTQDTTPPPPPSMPGVVTDLRIITVDWDGLDEDGEAMPVDFNHVRVYFGSAKNMADAEQVGYLTQAGSWNSGSMEPDTPVWVAISAVDNVGNESAMTEAQEVIPRKLVDDDSIRDELNTIDDKIADAKEAAIEESVVTAGGVTVHNKTTPPVDSPGDKEHDVWQQWTTLEEDGTLVAAWMHDGSAWVKRSIVEEYVPRINIGEGTFGELVGSRIAANSVTADKVLIGRAGSLIPWSTDTVLPHTSMGGTVLSTVDDTDIGPTLSVTGGTDTGWVDGIRFYYDSDSFIIPTSPSTDYKFSCLVSRVGGSASTQVRLFIGWYDQDGTYINGVWGSPMSSIPGGEVREVAVTAASGPDVYGARVAFQVQSPLDRTWIRVKEARFQPRIGATLIEDGAITTDKILANAITAGKIAALAIEADHISANAITADKIKAGAIDGKLITGARIRTAASGRRTELDVEGLRSYDSSGDTVLTTQTSDGSIEMKGRLSQTSEGVTLLVGSNFRDGFPAIQWETSTDYNYPPGVTFQKDEDNSAKRSTLIQGPGTSEGNSYLTLKEKGDGFIARAWKGSQEWRAEGNMASNYMFFGSFGYTGPWLQLVGGTSGSVGLQWNHPTESNDSFSNIALKNQSVQMISRAANGVMIGNHYSNASESGIDAGTRPIKLYTTGSFYIPYLDKRGSGQTVVRNNGELFGLSSARKYKLLEESIETTVESFENKLLSVDAKTWIDKGSADRIADSMTEAANGEELTRDLDECGDLRRIPGVIAEDLEAAGLDMFVGYENGEPEYVLYDRIGPALIPIIRRLRDRVDALEQQLGATA